MQCLSTRLRHFSKRRQCYPQADLNARFTLYISVSFSPLPQHFWGKQNFICDLTSLLWGFKYKSGASTFCDRSVTILPEVVKIGDAAPIIFLFAGKHVDVKSETLLNNHFFIIFPTKMLWVPFMTCVLKYLPGPILDVNIGYSFIVYCRNGAHYRQLNGALGSVVVKALRY